MSTRLANNGRLIDRRKPINFLFNSKKMIGYEGDSLAASLLANDQILVGRSFKYHRPRGIVASGAEEPNALINLGEGGSFEPNARATTTETFDGMVAVSQNHFPSLEFDVGAINSKLSQFLPAGFYYKMFAPPARRFSTQRYFLMQFLINNCSRLRRGDFRCTTILFKSSSY